MRDFYADLHIHLGANWRGGPVKVTASPRMTLEAILTTARAEKGLDLVGIVDTLSPLVQEELHHLCRAGLMRELPGGGLRYKNGITLIPGVELEVREGAHIISYFPDLESLAGFTKGVSSLITNINLSTQRINLILEDLVAVTAEHGGITIPAHAFTPHKGVYGHATRRLQYLFSAGIPASLPGLELGLSADTSMADRIAETASLTFLSNSDAHSLGKISREYNLITCREASWEELVAVLAGRGGRRVKANYGLDPRLGKYHRTSCPACGYLARREKAPVVTCPRCRSTTVVLGVLDRVAAIADWPHPRSPAERPPYHYQVPLEFVPGVGKKTLARLIEAFGSEINVLHRASLTDLTRVVGEKVARSILQAREGSLQILPGGGGKYGKVL